MAKRKKKNCWAAFVLKMLCYKIYLLYLKRKKKRFVPQFVETSESSWGYDPSLKKHLPPPANTLGKAVGNNKTRAS